MGDLGDKLKKLLILIWVDLIFSLFIAIQEINDSSQLRGLIMRAQFQSPSITAAMILAPLILNSLTVLVVWFLAKPLSPQEGNLFGCIVIYFIVAYELLLHILMFAANYLKV